jgi:hemolysin III
VLASPRPRLRGVVHRYAFYVALAAGGVLVATAPAGARAACSVYALLLAGMLGASALLHAATWPQRTFEWLRRTDHAAIFLCIAGTYTPFSLLGLRGDDGLRLLALAWGANMLGVVRALAWPHAPRAITSVCYVAAGWVLLAYMPELRAAVDPTTFSLILAGGVVFTLGALIYLARWPNPAPRVFGYHELFHSMVVVGCACHFAAVVRLA